MGKKTPSTTNKNKEKRLARKIEQRRIADGMSLVTSANQRQDLMSLCNEMLIFRNSGLEANLYIQRVTELEKNSLDWVIDLTVRNMQTLYETCAWGWNKVRKVEEMTDDLAWYLIAKEINGTPLAFSHFRFDMDHGDAVLYCYELQVEAAGRRRGLGQHLLRVLERLARATRMSCVRLTALTHNSGAAAFFRACGYKLDETSPPEEDAQHYEILSKPTMDSDPEVTETNSVESTEQCPLASGMQSIDACVTNTK